MGNSTLKYFSWKWITIGTWVGIIATELLGKGLVLINSKGKPLPEFFQDVYQFLTIGGHAFTVMTGLCIVAGGLVPYMFSSDRNTLNIVSMYLGAFLGSSLFGVIISASNPVRVYSILVVLIGMALGCVFGFTLVRGIKIWYSHLFNFFYHAWKQES